MAGQGYIAGRALATAIYLSWRLPKPLFLEGEAGVGKTAVARTLADLLGTPLIRLQCYEGLDISTAVYEWNYARQMMQIRLLEAGGEAVDAGVGASVRAGVPDRAPHPGRRHLSRPRPPCAADRRARPRRRGVRGVPAGAAGRFPGHHPRGRHLPRRRSRPLVIITSNRTREIHDALQAALRLPLDRLPDLGERTGRARTRACPNCRRSLAARVVALVQELRRRDLYKLPGVAETLDWAAALLALERRP